MVHLPDEPNEHGGRMLWFASWLTGAEGTESSWFYSGRGGETVSCTPPPEARGMRVRRWPSEGLDPEYVDLPLDGLTEVRVADLDFDARQAYSRI